MHLYKKNFRTLLYSADIKCQISYPWVVQKTAWNEQVCAHQKSYSK